MATWLASDICKMALLVSSKDMATRLLSYHGHSINSNTLRKVVRKVGQIELAHRGQISVDTYEISMSDTMAIAVNWGRLREPQTKKDGNKQQYFSLPEF